MSSHKATALYYGVATAALVADSTAALTLGTPPNGLIFAAALYLGSLWLAALTALVSQRRDGEQFSLFLVPLVAATGPFGAAIGLLAAIMHARSESEAISPSEWIDSLFERGEDRESDRLHERITFGLDDFEATGGVEPFSDILSGGAVLQKQMAIAKIARYFRPAFAPLLLQAARDPNAAVRVQAATALAKIERDFMARYIKLENDLRDLPDNDPSKLKLAELYDDYAHANLVDDANRQSLRQKSMAIYEACLAQQENADWRLKLGRLYLRDGKPEMTRACLKPVVEAAEPPRGAMLWYMEALFQLKEFGDLRRLADRIAPGVRHSDNNSFGEFDSLPAVWEGSAVWEGKSSAVEGAA
jgi:hypothetical protein